MRNAATENEVRKLICCRSVHGSRYDPRFTHLGPHGNDNRCMNVNMASSGFFVLVEHLVHHAEKLEYTFIASSIRCQRCLDNEMLL